MGRLRYLDRFGIEIICHKLAQVLFKDYSEPLPAFALEPEVGEHLLESALGLPRQPYYPRLHDKAGVLLRSLNKNHALRDGNKRIAMTSTLVFLLMNHQALIASNGEMVSFSLQLAADKPDITWQECSAWLRKRTLPMGKPLTNEQRKQLLARLPDEFHDPTSVAERMIEYSAAFGEVLHDVDKP